VTAVRDANGDDETPPEKPNAMLPQHRSYVLVLAAVIPPLNAVATTLGEILHELRVARDPVGPSTVRRIAELGETLEGVGANIRRGFGG